MGSAAELFLKVVLILIILELPIAMVLAWSYERTSAGVVRDIVTSASAENDAVRVPDAESIAVLPFANMSDDPENEFFADGMAEDILMRLSQVSELHVISRKSAMVYKGTNKPVMEIAEECHHHALAHIVAVDCRDDGMIYECFGSSKKMLHCLATASSGRAVSFVGVGHSRDLRGTKFKYKQMFD